jgi:hypothetical protein
MTPIRPTNLTLTPLEDRSLPSGLAGSQVSVLVALLRPLPTQPGVPVQGATPVQPVGVSVMGWYNRNETFVRRRKGKR